MDEVPIKRWLIDGMNVIGSRPDGWWKDRRGAVRRLAERLAEYSDLSGEHITVVFDGKPMALRLGIDIVFAPGGPNAADDAIVRAVSDDRDASGLTVVTSDRELARRVVELGARTEGAGAFLRRIEE